MNPNKSWGPRDGAALIEGFLNSEQLARCKAVFDWCVENPGPSAVSLFPGPQWQRQSPRHATTQRTGFVYSLLVKGYDQASAMFPHKISISRRENAGTT